MTIVAPLLFKEMRVPNRHPARYSDALIPTLARALQDCRCILDPFAGTGRIHDLKALLPGALIVGSELEFEWAAWRPGKTAVGNALHLPFANGTFDAVCTSPTYSNRMADHHKARDASRRNTYCHAMNRPLHPDNAGQLQWSPAYRDFHLSAWTETRRVLCPGGRMVLNCKDHVRDGVVQPVTAWHIACLRALGFRLAERWQIKTPGLRVGANSEKRVEFESVILLEAAP